MTDALQNSCVVGQKCLSVGEYGFTNLFNASLPHHYTSVEPVRLLISWFGVVLFHHHDSCSWMVPKQLIPMWYLFYLFCIEDIGIAFEFGLFTRGYFLCLSLNTKSMVFWVVPLHLEGSLQSVWPSFYTADEWVTQRKELYKSENHCLSFEMVLLD